MEKQKDPEQGNPKPKVNETQILVLQDQYQELNQKMSKLLQENMNGYNMDNMDNMDNNNILLNTKQKNKYRIDISSIKSYRTSAKKKQFVSRYPSVLCIHLNRLQFGAKDGRFVSFQRVMSLDNIEYTLMSVIVHHGNDSGGHYTTYKRTIDGIWYHISDKFVNKVKINQVLMSQAYMLFYQKNNNEYCSNLRYNTKKTDTNKNNKNINYI